MAMYSSWTSPETQAYEQSLLCSIESVITKEFFDYCIKNGKATLFYEILARLTKVITHSSACKSCYPSQSSSLSIHCLVDRCLYGTEKDVFVFLDYILSEHHSMLSSSSLMGESSEASTTTTNGDVTDTAVDASATTVRICIPNAVKLKLYILIRHAVEAFKKVDLVPCPDITADIDTIAGQCSSCSLDSMDPNPISCKPIDININNEPAIQSCHKSISPNEEEQFLVQSLWLELRQGRLTTCEYFAKLNEFMSTGLINTSLMLHASNRALVESGYLPWDSIEDFSSVFACDESVKCRQNISYHSDKMNENIFDFIDCILPFRTQSNSNIAHEGIQAMSIDGRILHYALSSSSDSVRGGIVEKKGSAMKARPCPSNAQLWWEKSSCEDDLEGFTWSPLPDLRKEKDVGTYTPTLLTIGGVINLSDAVIEVDDIIAVDSLSLLSHNTVCEVVILIKGRLQYLGSSTHSGTPRIGTVSNSGGPHALLSSGHWDSTSELGRQEDTSNQSPNGNGIEENNILVPDYSYLTDYMVLFVSSLTTTVLTSSCQIYAVVSLGGSHSNGHNEHVLEADQIPIALRYLSLDSVIVYGIHGLLLQIYPKESSGRLQDDRRNKKQRSGQYSDVSSSNSCYAGGTTLYQVDVLIPDILDVGLWANGEPANHGSCGGTIVECDPKSFSQTPLAPLMGQAPSALAGAHSIFPPKFRMHSSSSSIVTISFNSDTTVMLSLDDQGLVCIWRKLSTSARYRLVNDGTCLTKANSGRPRNISLSPSGKQVFISYQDRLILFEIITINTPLQRDCDSEVRLELREKGSLDILFGAVAKYFVQFYCLSSHSPTINDKMIRIWRFSVPACPSSLSIDSVDDVVNHRMTVASWKHWNTDHFEARSQSVKGREKDDSTLIHLSKQLQRKNIQRLQQVNHRETISSEMDQGVITNSTVTAPTVQSMASSRSDGNGVTNTVTTSTISSSPLSFFSSAFSSTISSTSNRFSSKLWFSSSKKTSTTMNCRTLLEDDEEALGASCKVIPVSTNVSTKDSFTNYRVINEDSVSNSPLNIMNTNDVNGNTMKIITIPSHSNTLSITGNENDKPLNISGYIQINGEMVPVLAKPTILVLPSIESPTEDPTIDSSAYNSDEHMSMPMDDTIEDLQSVVSDESLCLPSLKVSLSKEELTSISRMLSLLRHRFGHDLSERYRHGVMPLLATIAACFTPPTIQMISAALELTIEDIERMIRQDAKGLLEIVSVCNNTTSTSTSNSHSSHINGSTNGIIVVCQSFQTTLKWLTSIEYYRYHDFFLDISYGHNVLCALYLKTCANKSVAIDQLWQSYLQIYGSTHLRKSSRALRLLTCHIRKIDETANIKIILPKQIGYITGLQEIYARRVGLCGIIPYEIGYLKQLRVLSMGNNHLTGQLPLSLGKLKYLQRIVLHQNNLSGEIPSELGQLGCIVNVAGNPRLEYGHDVPQYERQALIDIFIATKGQSWNTKTNWISKKPVAKWYKVGVLSSHVHSLVMSSNGMEGTLPPSISALTALRMIELATMSGLTGAIPRELCTLVTLRRLCICRCGLTGKIPNEIGQLIHLEELQLFGNRLTGIIPDSIGELVNLKLLSLGEYTGGNHFTSDIIPNCIANLTKLEALFLANCNLKGSIPTWIGDLTELRQLDLQRNQLTGMIPRSIGRLENLLYLNIKDNPSLGGRVPVQELSRLTKLNRLSMVHCNFIEGDAALEVLKDSLPRCKIWI